MYIFSRFFFIGLLGFQPIVAMTYQYPTINSPGFYRLASNVTNQIIIAASNVSLDMNGCTVSNGTNGLVINSGLNNVTIKNGTVTTVTNDGIQVNGGCSNITLAGITIKNAQRALFLSNVTNGIIRNCDLLLSNTGTELNNCHNILMQNCLAQTNIYAGFSLVTSTTCTLLDCTALSTGQGNTDLFGNIYGFVNNGGQGNIFERCIANSTQGLTLTANSSIVAGFALLGTGTQCHSIINGESSNSTTSPSGFAEPYGIYLAGQLNGSTMGAVGSISDGGIGIDVRWSPDAAYAVVGSINGSFDLNVYSFNRTTTFIQTVASLQTPGSYVTGVDWNPGSDIIVAGNNAGSILLYAFDRLNNSLTLRKNVSTGTGSEIRQIVFSPDGRFLAMAINQSGSGAQVQTYRYDPITQSAGSVSSYNYNAPAYGVSWSPNGEYLAMAGNGASNNQFQIFLVNPSTGAIGNPLITVNAGGVLAAVAWSPDGNYIAVVGTGITNGNMLVYRFNGTSVTLTAQTDTNNNSDVQDRKIRWSPDMRYLTWTNKNGGTTSSGFSQFYSFNKGTGQVTFINTFSYTNFFGSSGTNACDWSSDGGYLIATGDGQNSFHMIAAVNAIQFPAGNTIMNNKVYCNSGGFYASGTGILGSSVTNFIAGNTAFDNTFNYIFVQNSFNQLFGEGPTVLQNISTQPNLPVLAPVDIPQSVDRIRLLLQSLVDDLI